MKLFGGERKENYIPVSGLKDYSLAVAPGHDDWITLDLGCQKPADDKIYIVLEGTAGLAVYGNEEKMTGAVSFYYRPEEPSGLKKFNKSICFKELLPAQDMYNPGMSSTASPDLMVCRTAGFLSVRKDRNGWNLVWPAPKMWTKSSLFSTRS